MERLRVCSRLGPLALVSTLAGGCGGPELTDPVPFRDAWRVEIDQALILTADDGAPLVTSLSIGSRDDGGNFANRGDVIVSFDGPPDRILVEMRRFTQTVDEASALDDFRTLSLFAAQSQAAVPPQHVDLEDDCVASGWQNDCRIRVYYDGLSQLARSGADLRMTLPPQFRGKVQVITEDSVAQDDYLDRGDVCVEGLNGSVDIETQSGNVWVSLAPETTPSPRCSPAQIEACEQWTIVDDQGQEQPAPWASECDCIAAGGAEFGRVEVVNRDNAASNIEVRVPQGLWTRVLAENTAEGQSEQGEHCRAEIDLPELELDLTGNDFSWQATGTASYPGPSALAGAGFTVQLESADCGPVAFTRGPDDFVGEGNGDLQEIEQRGNIRVGTTNIGRPCSELVP